MGSSASDSYCAFTKAVERLGDRWSLLIVRELVLFGPQGFNSLADGLPGHISRSVLSDKLRKLEVMGIVARMPSAGGRPPIYLLTPAGEQLRPVVRALLGWAEQWVPEDPAMAQRIRGHRVVAGPSRRHRRRPCPPGGDRDRHVGCGCPARLVAARSRRRTGALCRGSPPQ